MPAPALSYASSDAPTVHPILPLSAALCFGSLIMTPIVGVGFLMAKSDGPGVAPEMIGWLAIAMPIPAVLSSAAGLVARRRWRLCMTLASLCLSLQCIVWSVGFWASLQRLRSASPGKDGDLVYLFICVLLAAAGLLALLWSSAVAFLAILSRRWSEPPLPSWQRWGFVASPLVMLSAFLVLLRMLVF